MLKGASFLVGFTILSDGNFSQVFQAVVTGTFLLIFDQVANQGGGEALVVDSLGRLLLPSYRKRVALHEAGHLLVAYLVGVLPRTYTLSSLDAFKRWVHGQGSSLDAFEQWVCGQGSSLDAFE